MTRAPNRNQAACAALFITLFDYVLHPPCENYSFGSCMVSFAACKHVRPRDACHDGRPRLGPHHELQRTYLAMDAWAAAIFAFTASRLKLAPLCIGGNSIPVIASFSTCC